MRSEYRGRRRPIRLFAVASCLTLLLTCGPAIAEGFFGKLLNAVQQGAATAAWQTIDPDVQNCMVSQYNLNPVDLASQGIGPTDPRVSADVENCQQMVAQQGATQQDAAPPAADPAERLQELTAKYGPKAAKKIASGNIDIGFSQDEVADAWGNPDDRKSGPKGKEIWVYGQDSVTFTRGKVSAVGH